jgi:Domain of unknown function (DUF1737)
VCTADNIGTLINEVTQHMQAGWKPLGGVSVSISTKPFEDLSIVETVELYGQAIVRGE